MWPPKRLLTLTQIDPQIELVWANHRVAAGQLVPDYKVDVRFDLLLLS